MVEASGGASPNCGSVMRIFARFTGMGYLMLVSFLTIHALHVTGSKPERAARLISLPARLKWSRKRETPHA